jgi:hypothetical protein
LFIFANDNLLSLWKIQPVSNHGCFNICNHYSFFLSTTINRGISLVRIVQLAVIFLTLSSFALAEEKYASRDIFLLLESPTAGKNSFRKSDSYIMPGRTKPVVIYQYKIYRVKIDKTGNLEGLPIDMKASIIINPNKEVKLIFKYKCVRLKAY